MKEKFIAVAPKGKEFCFKAKTAIAVPKASAKKIVEVLNKQKYQLKDGETWHVYDNDWYYNTIIDRQIKRCGKRIIVYKYEGGVA